MKDVPETDILIDFFRNASNDLNGLLKMGQRRHLSFERVVFGRHVRVQNGFLWPGTGDVGETRLTARDVSKLNFAGVVNCWAVLNLRDDRACSP